MNYGPFYGMPYYNYPTSNKIGLFSKIFGNISVTNILNSTQKTLNFVNQVIPIVKQVQPIMNNAKTMFKVMNEFKKEEIKVNDNLDNVVDVKKTPKISNDNLPTFFM